MTSEYKDFLNNNIKYYDNYYNYKTELFGIILPNKLDDEFIDYYNNVFSLKDVSRFLIPIPLTIKPCPLCGSFDIGIHVPKKFNIVCYSCKTIFTCSVKTWNNRKLM